MANVSSSNGLEKRPKLRFPGFDEPYKQCRIGDIYAERSQRGASDMELLSVTMNDVVKPRSEIEGFFMFQNVHMMTVYSGLKIMLHLIHYCFDLVLHHYSTAIELHTALYFI